MGNKINKLKYATYDNTPTWSLNNTFTQVKVIKIYDGDTIWIAMYLKGKIYKLKVRLAGIDTPEMKPPKSQKNRDKEILAAKESKNFLANLIDQKVIWMKCGEWDKYGRLLANLYIDDDDINSINYKLIDEGFAYEYDGGTKKKFDYSKYINEDNKEENQ